MARRPTPWTAARHLRNVRYGNRVPRLDVSGHRPIHVPLATLDGAGRMFELVLDYGGHPGDTPTPAPAAPWECRVDPFSTRRLW